MEIRSSAFQNAERIPDKYTCDNDQFLSPPLHFVQVPEAAKSLTLIMDDPDVPKAFDHNIFTHWVLFNILPSTTHVHEGETAGTVGANTRGDAQYAGPCPPPDYEPVTHRYFFKLYALDTLLDLPEGATKDAVEKAMSEHILSTAELIGTYSRAS